MRFFIWTRNLLHRIGNRNKLELELDLEMRDHFEQEVTEGIRRGLTPQEARYAAQRIIGSAELHKDGVRHAGADSRSHRTICISSVRRCSQG